MTSRPGWDSQFTEDESERAERWRAIKAARIAKGLCPLCAKPMKECECEAHGGALRRETRRGMSGTEDAMRKAARALPPSDFGSTRAIQAAAAVADKLVADERARVSRCPGCGAVLSYCERRQRLWES